MRNEVVGVGVSVALGLACLVAAAPGADATPTAPTGLYAPSELVLTIGHGTDIATSTVERAVVLRCSPTAGGDHPAPRAACAQLKAAGGDIGVLTADGPAGYCSDLWNPVVVTVEGVWQGHRISSARVYGNACMVHNEGSLFAF